MHKKIIITYGTFDLFHIGHLKLLQRLHSIGNKLIVGVSTDEFNKTKGKTTIIPYEQRSQIVKSIKYVDMVIPEENWEQKVDDIQKYQIDIFAMGHDWEGKFDFLQKHCEVLYLSRTKNISSTNLKQQLNKISEINIQDINTAFEILKRLKSDFD